MPEKKKTRRNYLQKSKSSESINFHRVRSRGSKTRLNASSTLKMSSLRKVPSHPVYALKSNSNPKVSTTGGKKKKVDLQLFGDDDDEDDDDDGEQNHHRHYQDNNNDEDDMDQYEDYVSDDEEEDGGNATTMHKQQAVGMIKQDSEPVLRRFKTLDLNSDTDLLENRNETHILRDAIQQQQQQQQKQQQKQLKNQDYQFHIDKNKKDISHNAKSSDIAKYEHKEYVDEQNLPSRVSTFNVDEDIVPNHLAPNKQQDPQDAEQDKNTEKKDESESAALEKKEIPQEAKKQPNDNNNSNENENENEDDNEDDTEEHDDDEQGDDNQSNGQEISAPRSLYIPNPSLLSSRFQKKLKLQRESSLLANDGSNDGSNKYLSRSGSALNINNNYSKIASNGSIDNAAKGMRKFSKSPQKYSMQYTDEDLRGNFFALQGAKKGGSITSNNASGLNISSNEEEEEEEIANVRKLNDQLYLDYYNLRNFYNPLIKSIKTIHEFDKQNGAEALNNNDGGAKHRGNNRQNIEIRSNGNGSNLSSSYNQLQSIQSNHSSTTNKSLRNELMHLYSLQNDGNGSNNNNESIQQQPKMQRKENLLIYQYENELFGKDKTKVINNVKYKNKKTNFVPNDSSKNINLGKILVRDNENFKFLNKLLAKQVTKHKKENLISSKFYQQQLFANNPSLAQGAPNAPTHVTNPNNPNNPAMIANMQRNIGVQSRSMQRMANSNFANVNLMQQQQHPQQLVSQQQPRGGLVNSNSNPFNQQSTAASAAFAQQQQLQQQQQQQQMQIQMQLQMQQKKQHHQQQQQNLVGAKNQGMVPSGPPINAGSAANSSAAATGGPPQLQQGVTSSPPLTKAQYQQFLKGKEHYRQIQILQQQALQQQQLMMQQAAKRQYQQQQQQQQQRQQRPNQTQVPGQRQGQAQGANQISTRAQQQQLQQLHQQQLQRAAVVAAANDNSANNGNGTDDSHQSSSKNSNNNADVVGKFQSQAHVSDSQEQQYSNILNSDFLKD